MNGPCSLALLESALAGNLPADEEVALHQHLEACEACGAALERLAGGAELCREISLLLPEDELDEATPARDEWSAIDFTVEHLEPAEDPNVLGRLGGYDVLEIIGHGGMGVVLKAFDRELKRCVAIKVLAPHLAQSSLAKKRFAREAQAAAAVVHPNVLAIHQVQPGGRLPYLVMPLVAGESLAERLSAQGTLEIKETLRIGMQAAAGLAAAHEQGLVHRDVKPANILLETGVERAVLTDFGLARAADDVALTRWGIIAGTPQYMSPEQARGEPLDGRSDLFSLGCVLYEMSTGVSPFRADSMLATMRRLVDDAPLAMASLNPELPPWFIAIVNRLLEKDPARRFTSAREVSDLLEACLAHVQQPATVPLPASLAPHAKRGKGIFNSPRIGVIAVLGVLGLTLLGMGLFQDPVVQEPKPADKPPANAGAKDDQDPAPKRAREENAKPEAGAGAGAGAVDRQNARSVAEAYIAAVLGEDAESAASLAKDRPASPQQIQEMSDNLNVKRLAMKSVWVSASKNAKAALAISEPVKLVQKQPNGQREGLLSLTLSKGEDGWVVTDVDFETEEGADDELMRFLEAHPNTIGLPPRAKKATAKAPGDTPSATLQGPRHPKPTRAVPKRVHLFPVDDDVKSIACSPDGKLIAITNGNPTFPQREGAKRAVVVLDAETGKIVVSPSLTTKEEDALLASIEGLPRFEVGPVAFSPDGKVLAVGTGLGQVKLFHSQSGELIATVDDEAGKLAEKATPQKLKSLKRAMGSIASLAFSPDGSLLAVCGGSFEDVPLVFDEATRERLGRPATGPGRLKVFDVKTGALKHDLVGHSHVDKVAFSSDGSLLASAGAWGGDRDNGTGVILWDPQTGETRTRIETNANSGTHAVAFSPTNKLVVVGSRHYDKENDTYTTAVSVTNALSGITEWKQSIPGWANPQAFSPDGKCVVVLCGGQSIRFIETETGSMKHEIKPADFVSAGPREGSQWTDFAIAPQGHTLVIGGVDKERKGTVEVWSLDGRETAANPAPGQIGVTAKVVPTPGKTGKTRYSDEASPSPKSDKDDTPPGKTEKAFKPLECELVDAVTGKPIAENTRTVTIAGNDIPQSATLSVMGFLDFVKPKSGDVPEEHVAVRAYVSKSSSRITLLVPDEILRRADRDELLLEWRLGSAPVYKNYEPIDRIPLKQLLSDDPQTGRDSLRTIKLTPKNPK